MPGVERYPRLRKSHKTKYIRQPLRIFATRSENFSFNLRARAYAYEYNQTLVSYLLQRRKADARRDR